ncbi:class I SAM-dependent methyltransferase, partial [Turicibacter sanguinis]|nr:class I SAM-dependent methyltransferase [Turicibacter sanguinis]
MELVRRVTSHFKFNNKSSIINLHPLNEQYY